MFFSSDWALLTLTAECFVAYLHPLQWQHTFVPILSGQMLDFVMAPTSFLMGCHLDHFEEVRKVREGTLTGRTSSCGHCDFIVRPLGGKLNLKVLCVSPRSEKLRRKCLQAGNAPLLCL